MSRLREQFRVGEVFTYFVRVFQKPKPGAAPANFNLRAMHTINKISILMFIVCLIVMIYRAFLH